MTARPEIARPGDRTTVVADLLAAFMDDPVLGWVFPDRRRRHRYGGHFFTMQARRLLPGGLAWKADGGSALWAAPGRWRESPLDSLRLGLRTLPGVWPRPRVVTSGLLALEARHPREQHLYLATVGVRPEHQGKGLGSALLRPGSSTPTRCGCPRTWRARTSATCRSTSATASPSSPSTSCPTGRRCGSCGGRQARKPRSGRSAPSSPRAARAAEGVRRPRRARTSRRGRRRRRRARSPA